MHKTSLAILGATFFLQGCTGLALTAATTASTNQALSDRQRYPSMSCEQLRTEFQKNYKRARGVTAFVDPGATTAEVNVRAIARLLVDKKCRLPREVEVV